MMGLVIIHFLCMEESTISFGVPLKKESHMALERHEVERRISIFGWTILLNYKKLYQHSTWVFSPCLTCKSDRFRFITETLRNTLLQQPCPNLLPAVQAPHAICMPLEQFMLSAALKGIYIFCLQWASPFFRLSEPLPPVVLPLSSLPVLSLEEMKRRRKERNSLPWGALVRQRSRLSELPVILYMQWMGLRSKGGILLYIPLPLCLCAFFPVSPSCISPLALRSMKYALQLQKANTERSDRRRPRTIRLPDGIHRNEAWVALQNGCVLSENTGWTHQPPSVSLALC